MKRESVIYACCGDISGKLRGKGFPAVDFETRKKQGVGWTPTNVQITCFDTIAQSPYGAFGDLLLIPDETTLTRLEAVDQAGDAALIDNFVLGDVVHLDGRSWACCTRSILKSALQRLKDVSGLTLFGAFEHEFTLQNTASGIGLAFTVAGFRRERAFAEALIAALRAANITPDTVIREFGVDQFEITIKPEHGLKIADHGAIAREITQAVAEQFDRRASFTPMPSAGGVGNGVHIHLSFRDQAGKPATYDAAGPHGMSAVTGAFIAGILRHLPSIVAFTAPSVISYQRLVPHRWSAAFNNLGVQDREAAVRICPVTKRNGGDPHEQFNFEFRAADAAANPHLQLAAIVHAGVSGIEQKLKPPTPTNEDLSLLNAQQLSAFGVEPLTSSLAAALAALERDGLVRSWFPEGFVDIYLAHKRSEIAYLADQSQDQQCAAYAEVY